MLEPLLNTFVMQRKKTSIHQNQIKYDKLHSSELRYRRVFETAQDGILILDAGSGKIDDANPFLLKLLDYSLDELVGKQLWQIGVFKHIVRSKTAFLELQNKGYIRYTDLPLQAKDGRSINVEFISNVYLVGNQRVIQCNIRDITDRRKIEKAVKSKTEKLVELSKSQEEIRKAMLNVMEDSEETKNMLQQEKAKDDAMIASIGEGLLAVDNNRKIMMVNKAAEAILGWKISELIGKEVTRLPLEDEQGTCIPLEKRPTYLALSSGKATSMVYFFVKKDRTRFPLAINVTPIVLRGKIIGLIETLRDITRETEIDRAKSEFVSLASHQLRTPLGIMKWYLEALVNEDCYKQTPVVMRRYFDEIYKSNERVLTLVRDLLSVSRIDQGRTKNLPVSVNTILVINDIVEQMQIIAKEKKLKLHLTIQDRKIPPIAIDNLRFNEVIENLISNALEYTPAGGSVAVMVNKSVNMLLISVKDTGVGISDYDQKKLFTKFFRSEKAIGLNPEGSGLGLYLVKSYAEGWGGNISVESKEGKGAKFTISLPISKNVK